jgi:hypothetical protein
VVSRDELERRTTNYKLRTTNYNATVVTLAEFKSTLSTRRRRPGSVRRWRRCGTTAAATGRPATASRRRSSPDGAWIHAYLHRKEGDAGNAAIGIGARKNRVLRGLEAEWDAIAAAMLTPD